MPLHARFALFLFVAGSLSAQQPVPLIGIAEADQSLVNHGCTPTERTLRGSTHSFSALRQDYWFTATIPDLPEVQCVNKPVTITDRAVRWEAVADGRVYYIVMQLKANTEGVGRVDVGGQLTNPCTLSFGGVGASPAWRANKYPGDTFSMRCSELGDRHYDAETLLKDVINQMEVCRVVFFDKYGMHGRYNEAWYNYDAPICENMRAIDRTTFCKENHWWAHPNAVPANDICDGIYARKTP